MEQIEITTGRNGYPSHLHKGFIGFKSIDEALNFAEANNGNVVLLHRRDGWDFWESLGRTYEPIRPEADNYGCGCVIYRSAEDYQREIDYTVQCLTEDEASEEDIADYMQEAQNILKEFSDGHGVVICCGQYCETIELETMAHSFDTHNYAIGVEVLN